jgi:hypothetical protein
VQTRGADHADTRGCAEALAELYAARDATTPGAGFDAKAAEWRQRAVAKPN